MISIIIPALNEVYLQRTIDNVLENADFNDGYDAMRKEYGDMVEYGVIVPTKVERIALQNAASVAGLLLTTDAVVSEIPEKKAAPAPGGGMEDMY